MCKIHVFVCGSRVEVWRRYKLYFSLVFIIISLLLRAVLFSHFLHPMHLYSILSYVLPLLLFFVFSHTLLLPLYLTSAQFPLSPPSFKPSCCIYRCEHMMVAIYKCNGFLHLEYLQVFPSDAFSSQSIFSYFSIYGNISHSTFCVYVYVKWI